MNESFQHHVDSINQDRYNTNLWSLEKWGLMVQFIIRFNANLQSDIIEELNNILYNMMEHKKYFAK